VLAENHWPIFALMRIEWHVTAGRRARYAATAVAGAIGLLFYKIARIHFLGNRVFSTWMRVFISMK